MKVISSITVGYKENGGHVMDVFLLSDETPETLPVTGEGLPGMTAQDTFAPFSVLYVVAPDAVHKVYVADENGIFVGQ